MKNLYPTTAVAVVMTTSFVSNLFSVAPFALAANVVRTRLRSASHDVFGGLHDLVNEWVAVAIARSARQAASFKFNHLTDRDPGGLLPCLRTIGAGEGLQ